jgi:hypothetical protein
MKGRFADADHRRAGNRAGGIQSRVVETGDDVSGGAGLVRLADHLQHRRNGESFVEETLNRDRAVDWISGLYLRPRRRGRPRRRPDLIRHRRGRVRIDDVDPHASSASFGARSAATSVRMQRAA